MVQYPFRRSLIQNVQTVSFVDGSEQRCATSQVRHEWTIQLGLIDEQEFNALETFVEQQQGEAGTFAFTDPADGTLYSNCSLAIVSLSGKFQAPARIEAQLIVRENPN